jgi:hypothetical protein
MTTAFGSTIGSLRNALRVMVAAGGTVLEVDEETITTGLALDDTEEEGETDALLDTLELEP